MQKLNIVAGRMALVACLALLPAAVVAQSGSMSSASSSGNDTGTAMKDSASARFLRQAAEGGLAEVKLGQLATEKAASPQVKQFGQRMVDDHSKANEELKQVANSEGIQVPDKLSAKDKMTMEHLSKLNGEQFDKAYMSDMVKDHTKDVADFQRESQSGKDPQIKEFASKTLPTLQSHLKEAKEIAPTTTSANAKPMGGNQ